MRAEREHGGGQDRPWFEDPDALLVEVKRTPRHWGELPEIPGYDRLVELRRGGQGVVYRARQCSTDRAVAVKVLLDGAHASESARSRFQREVELVARLRHPHIVRVYDSGLTADGCLYYVMEYVEGAPLDASECASATDLSAQLRLFVKICDAVRHAHRHGVLHRDLKPGNILVDGAGDPHILDFGLAKLAEQPPGAGDGQDGELSRTGQFLGSLAYASPEQFDLSPDRLDLRADVYSLGVILYQLVTGRLPHPPSSSLRRTIQAIASEAPAHPRVVRSSVPEDVETIVLRSLAKEPDRRYQSVDALLRDVQHFLDGEPIDAKRDRTLYVLRKTLRRHRSVATLLALVLLLVTGFAASMAVLYPRSVRAEREARENLEAAVHEAARADAVRSFLTEMLSSSDPFVSGGETLTLRQVLDAAALRVRGSLREHPPVAAEVRGVIGRAYYHLGRLDEAEEHVRAALALIEGTPDAGAALEAQLRVDLAIVDLDRRRLAEAEAGLERALELCAVDAPEGDARAADCLQLLAQLRQAQFRLDEADALYARALAAYELDPEPDTTAVVVCLVQWAGLLVSRGEVERALEQLERARGLVSSDPEAHAHLWSAVLSNLGLARFNSGDLAGAEAALEEALESQVEVYGREHPRTPEILTQLGHVRREQGRHAESEVLYRRALELHTQLYGRESAGGASGLWNTGQALWLQGDSEGAVQAFEEALAIRRRVFDPDHHWVSASVVRLGMLLSEAERWEEALPYLEEAAAHRAESLGAEHSLSARARALLGECLARLGRDAEGEAALLGALEVLEAAPDATPAHREHALRALVALYDARGDTERARAYEVRCTDVPADHETVTDPSRAERISESP
jgi:serine/threonine-protein kinase